MDKVKHNAWLQDIFLRAPDGMVALALDGTILDANPAFAGLFDTQMESVRGKTIQDLLPPDQRGRWTHDLEKLISGAWTVAEGGQLQIAGRSVPIQIHLLTRTIYDNHPAIIMQFRNVAVFHTVEQALVASEDQWAHSFNAITDSMCLLNRNGQIIRANQTMTQTFASRHGQLIGRHYRDIFGNLGPSASSAARDVIGKAPCLIEETTFPDTEGWFSVSAYPLKNKPNELTGAILIIKNITEAHGLREALKKNEALLRQTAKMEAVGRMAGGIAHDFNNLLTSILGYSTLILRSLKDDDPTRNDLQEVIRAGERATTLTRQLLYFSREQKLETKVVQLNTVITNILSFLRRTIGANIQMNTCLAEGLWNIRADTSRLEQILVNLSINARDAMPQGGQLSIETSNQVLDQNFCQIHPGLQPGRYILFEVSDTGCGMPPEVREHIFEPFFTTKGKDRGTGLGLSTIYGIVHQLDGYISCYSELNQGTSFKIYLPQCLGAECQAAADRTPESTLPHGRETVLIVDDEPNIVTMLSQLLTELGYQVLTAASSAQALTLNATHPGRIDLALTDIIMPDLQGTELMHALTKQRPGLKALYMSGYADGIIQQTGGLHPADNYLQKPFSFQTLALQVRQTLDQPPAGG